ncbi:hypothetical protein [Bradyrhizobium sp. DOA1]|uniref:hypothetical protein n=1 Tax=Bradyrhizobium sp. DOA1 TaxID=1126616 RepID=UPI00077C5393|nr:hypothetical protein [Bradyrhizobium sp. DOA1]KYH02138.1 hypothetical protein SE91_30095 [Bradyrhizobium sp. DOA1]
MRCSTDRIKASAAYYAEANGLDALRSFLLAVAGVPDVGDVPEAERMRVNNELRQRVDEAIPAGPIALQGIARRAFAKMAVRK